MSAARLSLFLLVLVCFRCAPLPPAATPPPSSTPPPVAPPPERPELAATIYGHVREAAGNRPAAFALVSAAVASQGCAVAGEKGAVFADEHGNYELTIEAGTGPELVTCVLLDVSYGGATASTELPAIRFRTRSPAAPPERFRADLVLGRLAPLGRTEAEQLIDSFVRLLNGDDSLTVPMSTYVPGGPESLRAAVEDYRSLLGKGITWTVTSSEFFSRHQRIDALLRGSRPNAPPVSLNVYQEGVRSFHGPLIDYSHRSRLFVAGFSRLVSAGDAESLARLLTADDVDYPVDRAQRVIAKYRPPFASRGGSYQLVAVDERRHTLTYRLTFQGDGETADRTVLLGYGDGLLWLADESV